MNSIIKIYKSFYNSIKRPNSVLRHVSLVAGGTVIAQILNVVTLPALSRIYSPADFGVMAVYSSVIAILAEVSGLRYHLAIPLPKQERYAYALVILSFALQIVVVTLLTISLFISGDFILRKLSIEVLIPYKLLLPIGLFFIGLYNIVSQWAIRDSLFGTLGRTKVTQSFSGVFSKIALGLLGIKPLGLLIGTIVGQGGGISTLLWQIYKRYGIPKSQMSNTYRALIKYRKFPMYSTLFGMLNTMGLNMPQLFLSSYFSVEVTGLYTMASALLHIPSVFIGQALGQVFLQRASVAAHSGNLKRLAFSVYVIIFKIGLFPILFIAVFAPLVFSIVLGPQWAGASEYTILLAPWLAVAFVFSPLSMLYAVQDRQEIGLVTEIVYFVLRLGSMWIGGLAGSPYLTVGLFSLSGTILLSYRLIDILKSLEYTVCEVIMTTLKVIAGSVALVALPYIFLCVNANLIITMILCVIACLVYSYNVYCTLKKNKII